MLLRTFSSSSLVSKHLRLQGSVPLDLSSTRVLLVCSKVTPNAEAVNGKSVPFTIHLHLSSMATGCKVLPSATCNCNVVRPINRPSFNQAATLFSTHVSLSHLQPCHLRSFPPAAFRCPIKDLLVIDISDRAVLLTSCLSHAQGERRPPRERRYFVHLQSYA